MPKLLQEAGGGRADSPTEVRGHESISELALSSQQGLPGRVRERWRRACMSSGKGSVGGGKRRTESQLEEGVGGKEVADILGVEWMGLGDCLRSWSR